MIIDHFQQPLANIIPLASLGYYPSRRGETLPNSNVCEVCDIVL